MNITFLSLALVAGLTNTTTAPTSASTIIAEQTSILSKAEIVNIISNEQQSNINLAEMGLTLPSFTADNTQMIVKANNKKKQAAKAEKAIGDDE